MAPLPESKPPEAPVSLVLETEVLPKLRGPALWAQLPCAPRAAEPAHSISTQDATLRTLQEVSRAEGGCPSVSPLQPHKVRPHKTSRLMVKVPERSTKDR